MSNGDSLDGFVFPPFIPTSSTRPAPAAPQPPAQQPAPEPAQSAGARMVMPWDLETPIVRDEPPAAPRADSAAAGDDDEDLPWLEVPAARDDDSPPEEPAAAPRDDAFPDWMAWDQRDGIAAEADVRDTVAPVAGLEDFVSMEDLGYVAPAPVVEWAQAEPEAEAQPAYDAAPPPLPAAAPEAEPFPELVFDDAPSATDAAAPSSDDWSLSTPEAAAPPSVTEAPLPSWEESPAAAEPSFEVSVDEADAGAIDVAPAAAEPETFYTGTAGNPSETLLSPEPPQTFVADEEAVIASEPEPFVADAEPAFAAESEPFVADTEAVMAAEPEPFGADAEPAVAAEPDPFTAAAVAEAEAIAPAEPTGAATPFDDVADRLEAIARMLRERPDELLAGGSSDPLALLVTGYVMGYTARGR